MGQDILLVGSVPLKSVEDVIRTFGAALGPYLPAMPDGEVGERKSWVLRLSYHVFNGHIDLETIKRPRRVNGVEQLMPQSRDDVWQFKVRDGVDAVQFGNPATVSATRKTRQARILCSRRSAKRACCRSTCDFRSPSQWSTASCGR